MRAARKTELNMRLRLGERGKFQCRGNTDKERMILLTGDKNIGNILQQNMAFIPVAISPHGHTSSFWNRHTYGTNQTSTPKVYIPQLLTDWHVPPKFLGVSSNVQTFYGVLNNLMSGSFRAMTPYAWFDQEFGLITLSAIASHILRAHNKK